MKFIITLCLILSTFFSFSQTKLDSVRNIQPKSKYEKAIRYHLIGFYQQSADSNIYYQNLSLQILEEKKDDSITHGIYKQLAIANILMEQWELSSQYLDSSTYYIEYTSSPISNEAHTFSLRGVIAERQGYVEKAWILYSKGLTLVKTSPKTEKISSNRAKANLLANRGGLLHKQGKFKEAIDDYIIALEIRKELNEIDEQLIVLNNIAGIYLDSKKFDQATKYYSEMNEIASENKLEFLQMYALMGLASSLYPDGKKDESIQIFKKTELLADKFNDLYIKTIVYQNLGSIYLEMGQLRQAENYSKKSLDIAIEIVDPNLQAESLNNLGEVHIKNGLFKLAITELDSSLQISKTHGYDYIKMETFRLLSVAHFQNNNPEAGYIFLEEHIALKDSVLSIQSKKEFQEIITKYEVEQKNNEILSQRLEIETKDRKNAWLYFWLLLVTIAASVISYIFISFAIRTKKERQRYQYKLNSLEQEIEHAKKQHGESYKEKFDEFHQYLTHLYGLKKAELDVWYLQTRGLEESEMTTPLGLKIGGVVDRRQKLYQKIKQVEGYQPKAKMKKSDSIQIYFEKHRVFFDVELTLSRRG